MKAATLRKMPAGARVTWNFDGQGASGSGCVVKNPDEDVYVQWDDGQRTDAFDSDAVKHIRLAA